MSQAAPSSPAATRLTQYILSTDTTPTMMSKDSSGNVRVMSNIPGTTATYDLGASSLKWRDAFLSRDVTIGGTITVTGASTLSGAVTASVGLTVTTGGLTITAGSLTMGTAVSKLVPGATSFSIRNNADGADNIIVTDAGAATIRAGLTLTTGSLGFGGANSTIIAGATSFAIRDSANSVNNLSITDAGAATIRAGLTVSAGGATVTGNSTITGGLTITSTTATLIVPRMTKAQRNAITKVAGMVVYQTDDIYPGLQFCDGGDWYALLPNATLNP